MEFDTGKNIRRVKRKKRFLRRSSGAINWTNVGKGIVAIISAIGVVGYGVDTKTSQNKIEEKIDSTNTKQEVTLKSDSNKWKMQTARWAKVDSNFTVNHKTDSILNTKLDSLLTIVNQLKK